MAQVVAIGGELPEYQVNVDQERLRLVRPDDLRCCSTQLAGPIARRVPDIFSNVGNMEIPIRQQSRVTSDR